MFKQNLRTNSGAISMSEIEASSMAKPISTQKKKKKKKKTKKQQQQQLLIMSLRES